MIFTWTPHTRQAADQGFTCSYPFPEDPFWTFSFQTALEKDVESFFSNLWQENPGVEYLCSAVATTLWEPLATSLPTVFE